MRPGYSGRYISDAYSGWLLCSRLQAGRLYRACGNVPELLEARIAVASKIHARHACVHIPRVGTNRIAPYKRRNAPSLVQTRTALAQGCIPFAAALIGSRSTLWGRT